MKLKKMGRRREEGDQDREKQSLKYKMITYRKLISRKKEEEEKNWTIQKQQPKKVKLLKDLITWLRSLSKMEIITMAKSKIIYIMGMDYTFLQRMEHLKVSGKMAKQMVMASVKTCQVINIQDST